MIKGTNLTIMILIVFIVVIVAAIIAGFTAIRKKG